MTANPKLSAIASIIADPSRSKMLVSLLNLDGLPASELARIAGIKPQTASSHLAKMVSAGLLKVSTNGRHRYYAIASEEVAQILETLAQLAPDQPARTTKEAREMSAIRHARTCYGHLAGSVGVIFFDRFIEMGLLIKNKNSLLLTDEGIKLFSSLGINVDALKNLRRSLVLPCLDWTERRHHLAGSLGQGFAEILFHKKWLRRIKESRAVILTDEGKVELSKIFGIKI